MTQEKVKAAGKSDGRGEAVISPGKQALRRFLKNKLALIGTAVLVFLILFVLLGPAIWNVEPNETNTTSTYQMPMTGNYPLGTDELGRDVLARIMSGGRVSLSIGLASAVVAICLGTLIGALAGYYGKIIDSILMRFTDLAMTIPSLPLLIVLGGMIGPSPGLLVVLISILNWMGTARLVRSRFLTLRTLDYIKAAQAVGCKNGRIIFKFVAQHVPIIVTAT